MTKAKSPGPGNPLSMGWAGLGATTTTDDPIGVGFDEAVADSIGASPARDGVDDAFVEGVGESDESPTMIGVEDSDAAVDVSNES